MMAYKIDLANAAYSPEYMDYRNEIIIAAYNEKYKTGEETFEDNFIKVIHEYYCTSNKKYYCENSKIYKNNSLLHEYFNLDDSVGFFCEYIKYSNGQDYIFYKEDLYGYSVFEVTTKNIFNYYPRATFKDKEETFIGTDIHYNINNNIFAAGGCYWACPSDVFLVKADNPMEQFSELINIHEIIGFGNNIDFAGWNNNDIVLKIDDEKRINITEKEYMKEMIKIK
ncbi:MAG: hypothetical protein LBD48_06095 [Treponema sp.]|jgi:hypothetical protein|nr:hypothetical protein [Treponema sp.]